VIETFNETAGDGGADRSETEKGDATATSGHVTNSLISPGSGIGKLVNG